MAFVQGALIVVITSLLGFGSCFDLYSTIKYVFKNDNSKVKKNRLSQSEKWLEDIRAHKKNLVYQEAERTNEANDTQLFQTSSTDRNEKKLINADKPSTKKFENPQSVSVITNPKLGVKEVTITENIPVRSSYKVTTKTSKDRSIKRNKAINQQLIDAKASLRKVNDGSNVTPNVKVHPQTNVRASNLKTPKRIPSPKERDDEEISVSLTSNTNYSKHTETLSKNVDPDKRPKKINGNQDQK